MSQKRLVSRTKPAPTPDDRIWVRKRSSVVSFGHFNPGYQCGICGQAFKVRDRCVGLIGNPTSTSTWLVTRVFLFPDYLHAPHAVDGWALCRVAACGPCGISPETCAAHFDCYEVFKQRYPRTDGMDRLWVAACWRKPWKGAPRIVFPEQYAPGIEAVAEVGKKCGFDLLGMLPTEIIQIIRDFSDTALFWKIAAATDLCHRFYLHPVSELTSIPLSKILEWRRHDELITSDSPKSPRFVCITIDSRGVSQIYRLNSAPANDSGPRAYEGFIVEDVASCDKIEAVTRDGKLRLQVPDQQGRLQLWNTLSQSRSPQKAEDDTSHWQMLGSAAHVSWLTAVDLRGITGLTFFTSNGVIYAVHAHSPRNPVAELPSGCLPEWKKQIVTWVYIPVAPNDQIKEIALRGLDVTLGRPHSIAIRLQMAGLVSVGTLPTSDGIIRFGYYPSALVYGRREMDKIQVVGAYSNLKRKEWPESEPWDDLVDVSRLRRTVYSVDQNNLNKANISFASMENVKRIRVYVQSNMIPGRPKHNSGMVLEYTNGSKRAVGECRIGVDPFYDVEHPKCLKILNIYRVEEEGGDMPSDITFYESVPNELDRFVPYYYMAGTLVVRYLHNQHTFWAEILDPERVLRKAEV